MVTPILCVYVKERIFKKQLLYSFFAQQVAYDLGNCKPFKEGTPYISCAKSKDIEEWMDVC